MSEKKGIIATLFGSGKCDCGMTVEAAEKKPEKKKGGCCDMQITEEKEPSPGCCGGKENDKKSDSTGCCKK